MESVNLHKRLAMPLYLPAMLLGIPAQASLVLLPLYVLQLGGSASAAAAVIGMRALGMVTMDVPAGILATKFGDKTVMDLQLRQKYSVNLVLIKRGEHSKQKKEEKGRIINVPMPSTIIYEDDILMVAGSDHDLLKLPQE